MQNIDNLALLVSIRITLINIFNGTFCEVEGPGWLNELGSWITEQLIQAYHQYGVCSRPALYIIKKGAPDSQPKVII